MDSDLNIFVTKKCHVIYFIDNEKLYRLADNETFDE